MKILIISAIILLVIIGGLGVGALCVSTSWYIDRDAEDEIQAEYIKNHMRPKKE